jgi:hypothetical protein
MFAATRTASPFAVKIGVAGAETYGRLVRETVAIRLSLVATGGVLGCNQADESDKRNHELSELSEFHRFCFRRLKLERKGI